MAAIDVDDVAYASVDDLVGFFKFILDNDLAAGAKAHLASLGVVDVAISQQAVEAVKQYIEKHYTERGGLTVSAQKVIACACCNAGCRNK